MSDKLKYYEASVNDHSSQRAIIRAKSFSDAIDILLEAEDTLLLPGGKTQTVHEIKISRCTKKFHERPDNS